MEMLEAKPKAKSMTKIKSTTRTMIKTKSRSKRSSPRLYDTDDLPKFMQPLMVSRLGQPEQRARRPKSEIVRELKRLRALPVRLDDDDDVDDKLKVKQLSMAAAKQVRTLEQLNGLRLTRHRIEQLLQSANFEQAVRNCFVRININELNVLPEYRIAEIVDVVELNEGYYVGNMPTNIALNLRYEDLLEKHELNAISNMAFTREEFELWRDNCICQGIDWPTTELLARKKIEIYHALNSEIKLTSMLQQTGVLPLTVPMRPVPRLGLLERVGGVYPWKLQRPEPPSPPPELGEENQSLELDAAASCEEAYEPLKTELELETLHEELEAQRSAYV